jgi:hypothetical protein
MKRKRKSVRFADRSYAKRRRKMETRTIELQISKSNLEAALTDTFLRQLGYIRNNEDVEKVELIVGDQTPLNITFKQFAEEQFSSENKHKELVN